MSRRRGVGSLIKRISAYGLETEIRFHKDEMNFTAEVGGKLLQNANGIYLEREARELMRKVSSASKALNWIPIIEVSLSGATFAKCGVQLEFSRYYISLEPIDEKGMLRCEWEDLKDGIPTPVFCGIRIPVYKALASGSEYSISERVHYLPYDESVWQGLVEIESRLTELERRLKNMLGDNASGIKKFALSNALSLPVFVMHAANTPNTGVQTDAADGAADA